MVAYRVGGQLAGGDEFLAGIKERNPGAGDRRTARAAVGLQNVAVERDLAFSERLEVGYGAQGAADQPLDLLRATALLALGGLACAARVRRARQHAVFGRHPALPTAAQEGRQRFLDAGRAQHLRVAHFDEHRTFGVAGEIAGDTDRAQFGRLALAGSHGDSYFENFWMVERISSMARSISSSVNSVLYFGLRPNSSSRVVTVSRDMVCVETTLDSPEAAST